MARLPRTKDAILSELATVPNVGTLEMCQMEVLIDIRDNLEIPYITDNKN